MRTSPRLLAIAALCVSASAFAATDKSPTTEGRLVTKHDGSIVDVPLEHTDVRIRIDGHLADATITQRYRNPYDVKIEAVYLFPLPTGAAVNDMTIVTGKRTIRGSIQERSKAQQTYVAAKKQGLVAALLTQERANLFTQSIANLEPNATIEVTLRYVQRLDYDDGGYSLAFPMVAGPRYVPAASKDRDKAAAVQPTVLPAGMRSAHDINLRVDLHAGVSIEDITSTSHQIQIERPTTSRATINIHPSDTIPNKDFILRYQVAGTAPKLAVLVHRDGGVGSFMLVAQPPATPEPAQVTPREIVFVLDTSSSMRGAPLVKAKELIKRVLWTLRPDDTFQIVRFADQSSALGPGPIANKPKNVDLTLKWLAALEAGGGTEVTSGIEAALAVPHDPLRLRIVVFVSDGYVANEDEILALVGKHVATSRLFSFGVGSAVNRYLLEEMATIGRGTVQVVRPDEDTARAVTAFERRIDSPLLTDITIDWGKLPVADVVPQAIPDLFVGQPLVVAGHYSGNGSGTVKVRGKQAGRDVRFDVAVTLPDVDRTRPAIATVWARQRIGELSRKLLRKPDATAEREIIALSLEHRVLSQFTAFVAVDDSRVTAGAAAKRVVVPVEVPDAVRNISFGGWGSGASYGFGGYGISSSALGSASYGSGYGGGYGTIAGSYSTSSITKVPSVPQVMIASPTVSNGSLDAAIIRRYVKRNIQKITYCYEKALLRSPKLAGKVSTQFLIEGGTGRVLSVSATGLGDKEVEACIAQVVKAIEFPKAPGDGAVQVNYPFTLTPAKESAP
jgi:Ca-activated chloride channel homolog